MGTWKLRASWVISQHFSPFHHRVAEYSSYRCVCCHLLLLHLTGPDLVRYLVKNSGRGVRASRRFCTFLLTDDVIDCSISHSRKSRLHTPSQLIHQGNFKDVFENIWSRSIQTWCASVESMSAAYELSDVTWAGYEYGRMEKHRHTFLDTTDPSPESLLRRYQG